MNEQKVSHRYARALFDIAQSEGLIEEVYKDFQTISSALGASRELVALTKNPVFQQWRKKKIYKEIFGDKKVSDLSLNFLILLLDKRRGELIPNIVEQYKIIYNLFNKIQPLTVFSAIELTPEMQSSITKKLDEKTQMHTQPVFKVDPAVKGGIMVRIGDWVFDGTIRNQLVDLYKQLAEGVL
jgi:F-type H+-transporting ATPase subunit delta